LAGGRGRRARADQIQVATKKTARKTTRTSLMVLETRHTRALQFDRLGRRGPRRRCRDTDSDQCGDAFDE
jgi:hypothetical protein